MAIKAATAARLRRDYHAELLARLVEEAARVYEDCRIYRPRIDLDAG